jgi:hypothetical protein
LPDNREPWTLAIYDSADNSLVSHFKFDASVHRGASWADRPHELQYLPFEDTAEGFFVCQLSGYAAPGVNKNAWFQFDHTGEGWHLISEENWSHPTFDAELVAYGSDDRIIVRHRDFGELVDSLVIARPESYGHGTLLNERLAYSRYNRESKTDVSVWLWDIGGEEREIRTIPNPTGHFPARARPTISHNGDLAAWQELYEGYACTMVQRLTTTPPEDECKELRDSFVKDLRALADKVGRQ